jgi:hypothetical protein
MDTETVFKIIAMLDARIEEIEKLLNCETDESYDVAYVCGGSYALTDLRNHLQGYIKLQVAQVEGT